MAPSTTTTAPSTTTSAGPSTTTSAAPSTTTSAAPSTTTSAGPSTTTSAAPSTTTSAGPSATTTVATGPTVDSFTGEPKEDDGLKHMDDSLQIESGKTVVLSWKVSNAPDGVELTDPAQSEVQKFDSNTSSTEVTPQQETQDYSLVAVAGDQRSDPKTVHVSTHPEGHIYSPHAVVLPPGQAPQVNYFRVLAQGGDVASATDSLTAAPGATVTLAWEVEGDVAKVEIDNDVGDVTSKTAAEGDTSGEGTVDVKLPDSGDPVKYTLTMTPEDKSQSATQATLQVTLSDQKGAGKAQDGKRIEGPLLNTADIPLFNWPFRLLGPDGKEISDADLSALGATAEGNEFSGGFWHSDGAGGYGFDGLDDSFKVEVVVPSIVFDPATMKLPGRRGS
jgi:hypothetical protein